MLITALIAGLDPAIQPDAQRVQATVLLDARVKPGHEAEASGGSRMTSHPHETKAVACDLKAVEADGSFTGYASRFGVADLGRDLVLPGAFAESLARRGPRGIKMLFQHDPAEPIGVWLELREDMHGLYVRGRILPEVERGREVLALMRAGALDGLSIGFRTVEGRSDPKSGVRKLSRVDLWEISVVTFPMLPEARVSTVKNESDLRLANAIRRAAGAFRS